MFKKYQKLLLFLIFFIGFVLRLFDLGNDSFWFDEAGVVVAASQPTWIDTLDIARSHVSAMPLNYFETRFLLQFGKSEFLLRLPSVFWGSLAIISLYLLGKKLVRIEASLLAAFLLAIHPFHIQYSQELRFYAAGSFFYLAGTYFLLNAFEKNGKKDWIVAVLVALLGAYEFPYTVFIWLNGFFINMSHEFFKQKQKLINFGLASFIFGLLYLPGFLIFGKESMMDYDFSFLFLIGSLFKGLGWLPEISPGLIHSFWMTGILFFLFVFGLIDLIKNKNSKMLLLFLSILIQISFIIFSVFKLNYFVSSRQFLVFMPIMLLIAADFLVNTMYLSTPLFLNRKNEDKKQNYGLVNKILSFSILGIIVITSFPALNNYYSSSKSNAKEITAFLKEMVDSDITILCSPTYEPLLFRYYFDFYNSNIGKDQLIGINIEDLENNQSLNQASLLITRNDLSVVQSEFLESKNFRIVWQGSKIFSGGHRLYIKDGIFNYD